MMMMMIAKHWYSNNFTEVVLDIASKTNQYFNISIQSCPWQGELTETRKTLIGFLACLAWIVIHTWQPTEIQPRLELFQYFLQDYVTGKTCVANADQFCESTTTELQATTGKMQSSLFVEARWSVACLKRRKRSRWTFHKTATLA